MCWYLPPAASGPIQIKRTVNQVHTHTPPFVLAITNAIPAEDDLVLAQVGGYLARAGDACYIGSGAGAAPGPHRGGGEQQVQSGQVRQLVCNQLPEPQIPYARSGWPTGC
jgi:hypothetical protein